MPGGRSCWPRSPAGCAREPDDVGLILPFEEVVDALGRTGQVDRGLQVVPLDAIVGTVDRAVDFDRGFRPTSARLRSRWERIAAASAPRRGAAADLALQGRRPVLRPRRAPPRVGRQVARARGHRRLRDRGHDAAEARRRPDASASCRSRTTSGCSASACRSTPSARDRIAAVGPVGLRRARRGRRGVGLPADAGARALLRPRRGRAAVVRRGVHAGVGADPPTADLLERGETETDAYLRVAADRYLLAAHARVVRRGRRPAARGGAPARSAAPPVTAQTPRRWPY